MSESIALAGGMIVAPDGTITYDFEGHIHAQGVDLDASDSAQIAPGDRRVNWTRTSDGARVAELYGFSDILDATGVAVRARQQPGFEARAQLETVSASGAQRAIVETVVFDTDTDAAPDYQVRLRKKGGLVRILTSQSDSSHFVQRPDPARKVMIGDPIDVALPVIAANTSVTFAVAKPPDVAAIADARFIGNTFGTPPPVNVTWGFDSSTPGSWLFYAFAAGAASNAGTLSLIPIYYYI